MKDDKLIKDEDSKFVALCKKGDVDAFENLVVKHQKRALNIAYSIIENYEEACEITQEAFVSAYKSIKRFREEAKFSTWLYTIVVNHSKNRLKQIGRKNYYEHTSIDDPVNTNDGSVKVDYPSCELGVTEVLEKKDIQKKVQGCINSLDDEFKEIVILRDIQGFSYEEIRNILKIPFGTVKSRLSRARDGVKNCLKGVLGEIY